ncbi:MAG: alpha/beta hydrolase [Acidobacteriota bacterium]
MSEHIHGGPLHRGPGPELGAATSAMLMVHGRGATAASLLTLATEMPKEGMAYLGPQAAGRTWYDHSFLAPRRANEPGLSSGLRRLDEAVAALGEAGIPSERTVLLGFSQGACLALDYAARHPRRYAGVVAFSGGLIGPPGMAWDDLGPGLDGTPIFLGCSDRDPHVPLERVRESEAVLDRLGGDVEARIYPGMPHTVVEDEVQWVRDLLAGLP